MPMKLSWKVTAGIVALILLVAAMAVLYHPQAPAEDGGPNDGADKGDADKDPGDDTPSKTEIAPMVVNLTGTANATTESFELVSGISVINLSCEQERGNFIVYLTEANGIYPVCQLTNSIGPYNGSFALGVNGAGYPDILMGLGDGNYSGLQPGEYRLSVKAWGSWNISIHQPRNLTSLPDAIDESGRGDVALPAFNLTAGTANVSISYESTSMLFIWLHDVDGNAVAMLANGTGASSTTYSLEVESGTYYATVVDMDIFDRSTWSISITQ